MNLSDITVRIIRAVGQDHPDRPEHIAFETGFVGLQAPVVSLYIGNISKWQVRIGPVIAHGWEWAPIVYIVPGPLLSDDQEHPAWGYLIGEVVGHPTIEEYLEQKETAE